MDAVARVELEVREHVRQSGIDPVRDGGAVRELVTRVVDDYDERFRRLYQLGFPIRQMKLVDDYDERSLRGGLPTLSDRGSAIQHVWDAVAGFGSLQRYLDDPQVEEIWINEPGLVG